MSVLGRWGRPSALALSPTWAAVILVYIGTMIWTVYLSFTDSELFPSNTLVGFDQYARLFSNKKWNASLSNIAILGCLYVFGCLALGTLLAACLDRKVRFENFWRTIFLYPYAMSFVVTGLVWQWMMNPTRGIQASVRSFGWESFTFDWIAHRDTALYAVALAALWQGAGLVMIIVLSGMRSISVEQWRAAQIEGIPVWRTYVSIIIPQLTAELAAAGLLLAMGVIKTYDLIVAMTNGGPGRATEVPAKFIIDNMFERQDLGLAAAAATILVLSVVCIMVPFRYAAHVRAQLRGAQ